MRKYFRPSLREVVRADLADHFTGQRPPQPDAAGAAGDVGDVHPLGGIRGRLLPGLDAQVVEVHVAVHAQLELFLREPGDGHVTADAAVVLQQQAVRHRAGLLGDVARAEPVQQRLGAGAGDRQPLQRRHVVKPDGGARLPRFGGGDGGGEHRGPLVPLRRLPLGRQLLQQAAVGLEPVRALPAGGLQEERAELLLPDVERADAQVPRGFLGLQRVQDVVDFHEVLLGRFADVLVAESGPFRSGSARSRAGRCGTGPRPAVRPWPWPRRRSA